jgi:hypothetical protein
VLLVLYLLLSQTSFFRYWGEEIWTEYAKEICRRGMEALSKQQHLIRILVLVLSFPISNQDNRFSC